MSRLRITGPLLLLGLTLVFGGCSTPSSAPPVDLGPVNVRAYVDQADVTPGKPFLLTVEVDRRDDVTFELPDVGADIQGLIIMDVKNPAPESAGGRVLSKATYKLKAPKKGTYLIPGVEGPWKTEDNQVGTAGTGPILIEAARVSSEDLASEDSLRDLKALAPPDPDHRPLVAAGIGALLLLMLGLLIWRLRRRGTAPPPALPADLRALRDLSELSKLDLNNAANHARLAYGVSAILRRYLEERFGFAAWKMTTAEVLRSMPEELTSQRSVPGAVQDVLEASDLVKFAGSEVDADIVSSWLLRAREVVEATPLSSDEEDAA